jgi:hypothetical protein
MALNLSTRGQMGIVLMIVGSLAFLPAVFPGTGILRTALVMVAAIVLTYGTWLVGTDTRGRAV